MIQSLHIARCGKCGLYPAPNFSPARTLGEITLAALRETAHDAVALAVKKGWCPYPLLCPDCGEKFKSTLRAG